MTREARPDRDHVRASYWQFDVEGETEVEALDCALSFLRGDVDKVLISVRGRSGKTRYEKHDAAWLELDDDQVVRLIQRLAETLAKQPTLTG